MTMAVEDSTKPMAAMNAAGADSPASRPTPVSSAPQASTWATPRPKISPRSFHSREGCISSPMMNRNITTPSSATCRMDLGSEKKPMPNGPIARPAARYPSTDPSPSRLNSGTATTAAPSSTTTLTS